MVQNFVKPEGKRKLGRLRSKWEDNIKIFIKVMGCRRVVDWIHLVQDRVQWRGIVNINALSSSVKREKFIEFLSDYRLLKKDSSS
jgi:hypothetical protein